MKKRFLLICVVVAPIPAILNGHPARLAAGLGRTAPRRGRIVVVAVGFAFTYLQTARSTVLLRACARLGRGGLLGIAGVTQNEHTNNQKNSHGKAYLMVKK